MASGDVPIYGRAGAGICAADLPISAVGAFDRWTSACRDEHAEHVKYSAECDRLPVMGEFAVSSGWFNAEIMLGMAFVAVANYTQPNFELGYALKFMRLMLLILTACFNGIGIRGLVVFWSYVFWRLTKHFPVGII